MRWDYVIAAFVVAGSVSSIISFIMVKMIATIRKLTSNMELLASTDLLTGASNRRKFEEMLRNEIIRSRRFSRPLSLAMLDIDHFKSVNDSRGHKFGDLVLQTCTAIFTSQIRASDHLFRYAGDEFLILFPETRLDETMRTCERIRAAVEQHPFGIGERVTVSIGAVEFSSGMAEGDLIHMADQGLYLSKNSGRNRVSAAPDHGKFVSKPEISWYTDHENIFGGQNEKDISSHDDPVCRFCIALFRELRQGANESGPQGY